MPATDDGGPAFPRPGYWPQLAGLAEDELVAAASTNTPPLDGMSLRDWFAGQALAGYLASYAIPDRGMPRASEAAKEAYEYADAMIAARDNRAT